MGHRGSFRGGDAGGEDYGFAAVIYNSSCDNVISAGAGSIKCDSMRLCAAIEHIRYEICGCCAADAGIADDSATYPEVRLDERQGADKRAGAWYGWIQL